MNPYFVYLMTNRSKTLYTGVTNNLGRRVGEHKSRKTAGFTKRYSIDQLIYSEEFKTPGEAIRREKQIKGWTRTKKINLIEVANPDWIDLIDEISPNDRVWL